MVSPVIITVPGEPKGKGRPRFDSRSGRAYTSADTRSYEDQIRWAARAAMRGRAPLSGPLDAVVTAFRSVPASWGKAKRAEALAGIIWPTSKPDGDNILKCCDALNGIVFDDDALLVDSLVRKRFAAEPSLIFEIWPKTGDNSARGA